MRATSTQRVREWQAKPRCRIKLRFVPGYCPYLSPIERLWGLVHKEITHSKEHKTIRKVANTILGFLRTEVTQKWATFRADVPDDFRLINPADFWVIR